MASIMLLPRIYLLLCVTIWGWTFVATKIALDYVTPFELMGLRFLLGLPLLGLIIKVKGIPIKFERKDLRAIGLASAIITVHFFVQITGLKYTSATNTGWIISISPLIMALLAYFILKEKLRKTTLLGIGLATVGILLLVSKGKLNNFGWLDSIGDWLVLVSAHTWAFYTVAVRDVSRRGHPLAVTFAVLLPSTVIVVVPMIFLSDWARIVSMPVDGLVSILFLGLIGLAIAHWFWQEGVARVGAARAGLFLYLEPLATVSLAVTLLNEPFGWLSALAGGLVLFGVYISERK